MRMFENQLIWESYIMNKPDFSLNLYYKLLNEYLQKNKKWSIRSLDDSKNSDNQYGIFDENGKHIGKIEVKYNPKKKALILEHIGAAFDEKGNRIKGLGLVKTIYDFEKTLPLKYNINYICVDPVSKIVRKQFIETYGIYEIKKGNPYWCAIIK